MTSAVGNNVTKLVDCALEDGVLLRTGGERGRWRQPQAHEGQWMMKVLCSVTAALLSCPAPGEAAQWAVPASLSGGCLPV